MEGICRHSEKEIIIIGCTFGDQISGLLTLHGSFVDQWEWWHDAFKIFVKFSANEVIKIQNKV